MFIGSDINPVIADQKIIMDSYGANSSLTSEFFELLAHNVPYFVSNPNDTVKNIIIDGVQKTEDLWSKVIKSQMGLGKFDTDSRLSAMPELSEFYLEYQNLLNDSNQMKQNPSYSYDYIHNTNLARNYAHFLTLLIEASKIARKLRKKS